VTRFPRGACAGQSPAPPPPKAPRTIRARPSHGPPTIASGTAISAWAERCSAGHSSSAARS